MRGLDKFSEEELEEALIRKRYRQRQARLGRLREEGRVLDVARDAPAGGGVRPAADRERWADWSGSEPETAPTGWRLIANRALLVVEVAAVLGFVGVLVSMGFSVMELNRDTAALQQQAVGEVAAAQPTTAADPVIDLVVLPTGHKPPVDGQPIVYEEAGEIPGHLLPQVAAYVPPPIPAPSVEQPRRVEIESIDVTATVVQGHEPEQLKKGVGHSIGTAMPGQSGNMVLSAHNDIYGEIFRHLDKLSPGDEIVVSTARQRYTYVVNEIRVVAPTDVEVMDPTDHASLTLISCYPYLINNKRIVVFADLVEESSVGLNG
ncbi:MAG: class D sortase [Ardenticatenaceae bacterium]|nr:class D sortase [Ardenticatenaceae bacterium]